MEHKYDPAREKETGRDALRRVSLSASDAISIMFDTIDTRDFARD